MARNKSIPDDRLIALIHSYFTIECKKDVTKLKFPDITAYITAHGYPDYQVTTLRRTQAAREYWLTKPIGFHGSIIRIIFNSQL